MLAEWPFYRKSLHELLFELQERIRQEQKTFIVTANPVIVMQGQRDAAYRSMVLQADFITPDGIGVVKACKWLGNPVMSRIAGFDVMESLLQLADQFSWKIYLLGAKEEAVSLAKENIAKKYQGASIVGFHHGYFTSDAEVIAEIKRVEPDLIFVGMGCPRQERWIVDNMQKFRKGLFIGVGGSLDVFSGIDKRAPETWINCYLEWFYRIVRKPSRAHNLKDLALFLCCVLKESMLLKWKKFFAKEKLDESP